MGNSLQFLISVVIGTSIVVGGITAKANDILASAKSSVNSANVYQLSTALELYYLDHNSYPAVKGGDALVSILQSEKYIKNRPLDPSVFNYQAEKNGQDYSLGLK